MKEDLKTRPYRYPEGMSEGQKEAYERLHLKEWMPQIKESMDKLMARTKELKAIFASGEIDEARFNELIEEARKEYREETGLCPLTERSQGKPQPAKRDKVSWRA